MYSEMVIFHLNRVNVYLIYCSAYFRKCQKAINSQVNGLAELNFPIQLILSVPPKQISLTLFYLSHQMCLTCR